MKWKTLIEGSELEVKMIEDILKENGVPYVVETCDDVTPRAIFGSSALMVIKVPEKFLEEAKRILEEMRE
ncbi:hypothetical protein THMA_0217 [Thermotoga maritima MSB8]|uniref:DUF2007 domain-containing protein n=1 Tax=Thermotoga maritima (strain ATCC 43589 / DSM 3109 / JCM 10099 / NBRC 100826 / MSB8) TaxID=243274 RepID=Q9WY53_THEMA|nr:DUF2007 domain-containing protein [Thermotoga maritima]AAD35302.1 hypothetical protein TM_0210 [Thermotoga maritima MSB8]AGL49134.1 hypothetical protein Tmari_0208 [Thermotoga maritima MSB8]AHD18026.1 hypothetical protein THEMA_03675 [Thermotoga maritima MSB8]AKE26149.1 hypothetical protein THMC_0217 [Thermotoga maritima]AKE28012.1 hypothetical protein THMA_0217 [Thermotoga maritima MSB8]